MVSFLRETMLREFQRELIIIQHQTICVQQHSIFDMCDYTFQAIYFTY